MLEGLTELVGRWQEEADLLRRRGAARQADALESAAEDLEERLQEWREEPLSLQEAANESGYTADHLRRLIRQDRIPSAGDEPPMKIRRRDLPLKPGHRRPGGRSTEGAAGSRSRVARTVVDSD